ncbi:hypothetical protein EV421DRAFT_238332 [Armillaria borealis]|uniref:Uncharacterized protein n=1 Tax=Armillaria borealis TaxID=47425 RepID=A0AA39IUR9_9AGAR|nr:hypothetical protein EV421DRAFT_238332 [Armillaria borealis]
MTLLARVDGKTWEYETPKMVDVIDSAHFGIKFYWYPFWPTMSPRFIQEPYLFDFRCHNTISRTTVENALPPALTRMMSPSACTVQSPGYMVGYLPHGPTVYASNRRTLFLLLPNMVEQSSERWKAFGLGFGRHDRGVLPRLILVRSLCLFNKGEQHIHKEMDRYVQTLRRFQVEDHRAHNSDNVLALGGIPAVPGRCNDTHLLSRSRVMDATVYGIRTC